jgi:transcriptional regulator with XRE-family HTH domain
MTLPNRIIFSKNLNYFLEKSGKTQKDVCEDLNFSSSTVSDWFSGKKYPRIDTLQTLADYFNIKKSQLIEERLVDFSIMEESSHFHLNEDEDNLLKIYRRLDKKDRAKLIGYAQALSDHGNKENE